MEEMKKDIAFLIEAGKKQAEISEQLEKRITKIEQVLKSHDL